MAPPEGGDAGSDAAAEKPEPAAKRAGAAAKGSPADADAPAAKSEPAAERTGSAAEKAQEAIDSSLKSIRGIFKW
jgi:hypothetical protein